MNRLKTILILTFFSVSTLVNAQLDPQYTQYHFNQYLINPAFGGLYESTSISFNSRAQWYGMEGAPFTNTLTLESSMSDHSGIGLKAMNDRIGIHNNTEIMASASYFISSHFVKIGMGLQGGITNVSSDLSLLDSKVLNDPELDSFVPNSFQPNFGVGFVIHRFDYFLAVSIPRILETRNTTRSLNDPRYDRNIYVSTGYRFSLFRSNDTKLQTQVRVMGSRFSFDIAGTYFLTDHIRLGAMIRDYYGASFFGKIDFDKHFSMGYSFELPTNNLFFTNYGTHEVTLSYVFTPFQNQSPLERIF
ncbi:MAG: PorP/SprF family type IX secretion system membrane protein [Cyclobacteriaceae bacterium]